MSEATEKINRIKAKAAEIYNGKKRVTIIGRGVKMDYLPDLALAGSPVGSISGELSSFDKYGVKVYEARKDKVSRIDWTDIDLIL